MASRLDIIDMQAIALMMGGKCLSKEYWDEGSPLSWRCESGHNWDAPYSIIAQGGWCMQCAKEERKQDVLEELQNIAIINGGLCLSPVYKNARTKLKWQCANGHQWKTVATQIKKGHWCYQCHIEAIVEYEFKELKKIVAAHGGLCLSATYKNNLTHLKFQCREGHLFQKIPSSVKQGSWCPHCSHRAKLTIEECQQLAEKRNGKCLTAKYINMQTHLKWECEKGHTWMAAMSEVKHQATWCPYCAGKAKHTIEEMHEKAKERGGKCLSTKYINSKTKLEWECALGHRWETMPAEIYSGRWCPKCKGIKIGNLKRLTIADVQKLAESKGGKLLSEKYIDAHTPMKWQCGKGHQWMANAGHVKHHTWCPVCSQTAKHTIEEMHLIATLQKGKCLSKKIVNNTTKLKWKCANGHIWMAIPKTIVKGHWCARCSHKIKRITHEQIKTALQIKYFRSRNVFTKKSTHASDEK